MGFSSIDRESKFEEVMSKFTENLHPLYETDPVFRGVVEQLIRDEDPYYIIGFLIEQRIELMEMHTSLVESLKTPLIVDDPLYKILNNKS